MAKDMPHWRRHNEFDFSDDYNRAGGAELRQKLHEHLQQTQP